MIPAYNVKMDFPSPFTIDKRHNPSLKEPESPSMALVVAINELHSHLCLNLKTDSLSTKKSHDFNASFFLSPLVSQCPQ